MSWFFAVLLVLGVGAVAVVFAGGGGAAAPAYDDRPDTGLPDDDRPVTAADLRGVRLSTAVRGYRADEVDALLERLARQLEGGTTPSPEVPEAPDNTGTAEPTSPAEKVVLRPGERPQYPDPDGATGGVSDR